MVNDEWFIEVSVRNSYGRRYLNYWIREKQLENRWCRLSIFKVCYLYFGEFESGFSGNWILNE